jgi:hypothetical protein
MFRRPALLNVETLVKLATELRNRGDDRAARARWGDNEVGAFDQAGLR